MKLHFIFTESSQVTDIPTTQLYSISVCHCKVTLCVHFHCVYLMYLYFCYFMLIIEIQILAVKYTRILFVLL